MRITRFAEPTERDKKKNTVVLILAKIASDFVQQKNLVSPTCS